MKKFVLGAATVLAIAAPAVASADTTGYVSFAYNTLDDDNDGNKEDYLELNGAVAGSIGGMWNLQFDAAAEDMNHGSHTDQHNTAIAHLFARGDGYAWGGFGGFSMDEIDAYVLGAEGAFYLDRFSLSGSAFFGGEREDDSTDISGYGLNGTWFAHDNLSVGVDVNYYNFDFGGPGNEQDGTIYGINAEYQFANGFSIYGGWHTSDEDYFGTDKSVDSFTIGGRFNFGTSSLIERDRNGASMPGASQLDRAQVFAW